MKRSVAALGLAATAAVLLVLLAGVAHAASKKVMVPKPPPAGWAIAYYQYPGYWVMDSDGSARTWVFQSFVSKGGIDVSPDGSSFVLGADEGSSGAPIYLGDLYGDGSSLDEPVAGKNCSARWSPGPVLETEEKILFSGFTSADRQDIYIMSPCVGSEPQNLTADPNFAYPPQGFLAWSPDADAILSLSGDQLVIHHLAKTGGDVFIESTDTVGVLPAGFRAGSHMDWARTNAGENRVAVDLSFDGGQTYNIYVVDLASGAQTQLTTQSDLKGAACKRHPSWSPNASKIAFGVYRTGPSKAERNCCGIWVMDADGSNKTQLFSSGDVIDLASDPDWWAGATE